MPVNKSVKAFKEERLNCAQSVARGFQELLDVDDDIIKELSNKGGGKAQDGQCGALFSALELTDNESHKDRITEFFLNEAGSQKCREIRKANKLSCAECVGLAAKALHEQLG